jgi:hypothetical protein
VSLPVPVLDDKTWTEIVEDARSRIPRRSPDWTDWNAHDPGITFLELFAWLAEMQRFRLDQVSAATNRSFFKLVDLDPHRLRPANVWVRFGSLPAGPRKWLLLPAGFPVSTSLVQARGEGFEFAVARDTFVSANRLRRVTTDTGSRRLDNTESNESPEIAFYAFGEDAPIGAVLELEFESEFEAPEFEIWIDLHEDDLPPRGKHEGEEPELRPSIDLVWEYYDGSEWRSVTVIEDASLRFHNSGSIRFETPPSAHALPFQLRCRLTSGRFEIPPYVRTITLNAASLVQVETEINELLGQGNGQPDQTFALDHGNVLVDGFERRRFQVGDVIDWDAFIEKLTASGPEPAIARMLRLLPPDLLAGAALPGAGDSSESQARQQLHYNIARVIDQVLDHPSLLDPVPKPDSGVDPMCDPNRAARERRRSANRLLLSRKVPGVISDGREEIEVGRGRSDRGIDWQRWERVDDFLRSGPKDPHYVIDATKGEIRFGNGMNGQVPAPGDFVRARVYRHTRGARGNLPPGQLWTVRLQGIQLDGTNPRAASGGGDAETILESRARAEQSLHERSRAITCSDLESLACSTPGTRVARTRAIPNHHPGFPYLRAPGNTTVVVVPAIRRRGGRLPIPGDGFLETVKAHLERHRLLTTSVHVIGPVFIRFSLSVLVFLARRSSADEVRSRLQRELVRFFDALDGGPAPGEPGCTELGGWPLGRAIYPSEIYERIDLDPGVEYATQARLHKLEADGAAIPLDIDKPLTLPLNGLPGFSLVDSDITMVRFGEETASAADACIEPCTDRGDG